MSKSKVVNIRIDEYLLKRLDEVAEHEKISRTQVITNSIENTIQIYRTRDFKFKAESLEIDLELLLSLSNTNEYTKEQHLHLLNYFLPHKDYRLEEYFGVSMKTVSKTGAYALRLQYEAINGNSSNSSTLELKSFELAINVIRCLMQFEEKENK